MSDVIPTLSPDWHFPSLKTDLPGPKTAALIARDERVLSPSYPRGYPLSIRQGKGAVVEDLDGNRFLDYCAGIATCSTGHCHPEVVAAITEQAGLFLHMSGTDFYYDVMAQVAEQLAASAPGASDKKVFLSNSGTEAIEAGMKLARSATKRKHFISFYRGFHGRTFGSMSLSASKIIHKSQFMPLVPGVHHAHYPYFYRDIFKSETPEACADACIEYINEYLFKLVVPPDEVAAFVVEPIQGEGGYVVPPANFLPALQKLAREHGILIMADEVQSGAGRTGNMWASQLFPGFEPDIIASAKGIASGLPLGATIARADLMDWHPGAHATTFGGNPVSCAAALKTFDLLNRGLMANAKTQGDWLKTQLVERMQHYDFIGDVRGEGLMLGIEIVESKAGKQKAYALRDAIVDACYYEGLLILGCGSNSIRFSPPLMINQAQSEKALEILDKVLKKAR